jgi:O-6-methylguanine DNA methyltransferase
MSSQRFAEAVLRVTRRIPPGRVATYGDVAAMAGRPRAARAVGNIMRGCGDRSVPCHRVVGAGGALGGYGGQEAMKRAITESCYDLQYYLYTVALDKYLRLRLPEYDYEEHFGGVRYVFLRGVAPERPALGIYRDRPSAQAITRLSSLLGTFAEVKL